MKELDREYYRKLIRNHHNIEVCLTAAYESQDFPLLVSNIRRLNALTRHLMKQMDITLIMVDVLKAENEYLTEENHSLMDQSFLQISSQKGRYQEAKKMLDEFYAKG